MTRVRRRLALVLFACAALPIALSMVGSTYASFSDFEVRHEAVQAGSFWIPPDTSVPPECAGLVFDGPPIIGTGSDDVLIGTTHAELIHGLDGNDTIYGGNGKDCLVGGDGDDELHGGNAMDVLLGGLGDDVLDGDNGPDILDGGAGTDTCDGGLGPEVYTDCEVSVPSGGG